jgi:hypothetical protein
VSAPIYATGGSMLVEDEKGGLYLDDDAWKMATTDALGVACKHLGIASNIYRGFHERTKTEQGENRSSGGRSKAPPCPKCGNTDATIVGKPEYGGGFVCYRAKGGCGHKWQAGQETKREGDPPAQPQHSERVVDILDAIAMSEELRHLEKIGAEIKALAPPLDATERQTLASAYSKRAKQLEEAIPF